MENSLNREELLVLANEIRRRHEGYVDVWRDSGYNYLEEELFELYHILITDFDLDPSEKNFNFFLTRLKEVKTYILRKKKNPTTITKKIYRNLSISKFKKAEKLQSILEKLVNLNLLIRMATAYFEQEKEKEKRNENTDLDLDNIGRLDSQQIQEMFNKYGILNIFIMYKLNMDTKIALSLKAHEEANKIAEEANKIANAVKKKKEEEEAGKKPAVCPICMDVITDPETCRQCKNGHKFHSICYPDLQTKEETKCPLCRIDVSNEPCETTNDIFSGDKSLSTTQKVSGGRRCRSTQKRKKTIRKKRKNKKRTRRFR